MVALIVAGNLHDTPALRRAADIGLVQADRGTRMARDHLDLMFCDGTWSPLTTENIQKFIQPELAMIVSRLSTATIFSISLGQALTTPIQLSWSTIMHMQ